MIYVFIVYLFIHLLLYYYYNSNLFSVQSQDKLSELRCLIFRNIFNLELYNSEIQNFVYWRHNFQICRNLFSRSVFSSFFFSITLCNKLCYSDHASFLDGFYDSLAGVLFFYYSLHKSQYQIKYNIKITFLRVKIENKNLNAILDSKNFKIQKFEKRGRAMAQLNGTSHGLRSFPKLRVLGIW